MANSGKQSPLGVNVLGSLLQNIGFYINPTAQSYMGVNKSTDGDYTPGKIVNDTSLKWLTYAINDAYKRGAASESNPLSPSGSATVNATTYNNLINIGQSRIPALGNSPPPTWEPGDPGNVWVNQHPDFYTDAQAAGPANSGYGFYNWDAPYYNDTTNKQNAYKTEGQLASWYPFLATVEDPDHLGTYLNVPNRMITQWGWVRCMALQAWNEFNFNGKTLEQLENSPVGSPEYKFFVDSFNSFSGFMKYSNEAIYAIEDSQTFLKGTYSNQDDLISADIAGVSLSSRSFGQDLINLGKAIDFTYIKKFGLPSTIIQILQKNNALTQSVILALLTAGISQNEINDISSGNVTPNKSQEQKIYSALLVIQGEDLKQILVTLNCRTKGLNALSDLVSVKKLFPLSFTTLTVPIYNTSPGPTNSKTYYLLFVKQELNPQLVTPKIKEIVGTIIPPEPPPLPEPTPPPVAPVVITPPEVVVTPPIVITDLYVKEASPNLPPAAIIIPQPPDLPAPGGGGCVALESYIPLIETEKKHNNRDIKYAWMLENGMKISLGTDKLEIVEGSVTKALNDYQPCVRIVTSDGISLVCSTTAPICTKESGFIPAPETYGKRVAVMRNGKTWFDEVVSIEDVGMKFVRVIDTGNNSFWAGEVEGSYILHHNIAVNNEYEISKN